MNLRYVAAVLAIGLLLQGVTNSAEAQAAASADEAQAPQFSLGRLGAGAIVELPVAAQSRQSNPTSRVLLRDKETNRVAIADLALAASQAPAMWAATSEFVDLSWTQLAGVKSYAVSRDGASPVIVLAQSYRDSVVTPGDVINYRVEALSDDENFEGGIWGFEVSVPQGSGFTSETLGADLNAQMLAVASYTTATVQHQTFIPESRINAPSTGCTYGSGYRFGGDGRGYLASGFPYRTRLQAVAGFSGEGTVTSTKNVGVTRVYNTSGVQVASATASSADMSATRLAASSASSVDIRFRVLATNPFCSAGAIDAAFTITVTKSGSWYISSGSHRQMPNHELYVLSNSGGWVSVYRRSYADPLCLLGAILCPLASMSGYAGAY